MAENNAVATEKTNEKVEVAKYEVKTREITITLHNGLNVTLDVIEDRDDWSYDTLQAQSEGNTAALVNGVLTEASRAKLRFAGARVRDFKKIAEAVGEALELLDEDEA